MEDCLSVARQPEPRVTKKRIGVRSSASRGCFELFKLALQLGHIGQKLCNPSRPPVRFFDVFQLLQAAIEQTRRLQISREPC